MCSRGNKAAALCGKWGQMAAPAMVARTAVMGHMLGMPLLRCCVYCYAGTCTVPSWRWSWVGTHWRVEILAMQWLLVLGAVLQREQGRSTVLEVGPEGRASHGCGARHGCRRHRPVHVVVECAFSRTETCAAGAAWWQLTEHRRGLLGAQRTSMHERRPLLSAVALATQLRK